MKPKGYRQDNHNRLRLSVTDGGIYILLEYTVSFSVFCGVYVGRAFVLSVLLFLLSVSSVCSEISSDLGNLCIRLTPIWCGIMLRDL